MFTQQFNKKLHSKHGKFNSMNCKQFNSISLEEVLLSLGHLPTKQNEKKLGISTPLPANSKPLLNWIKDSMLGIFIQKASVVITLIL